MKKIILKSLVLSFVVVFSNCSKDDEKKEENIPVNNVGTIYGKWEFVKEASSTTAPFVDFMANQTGCPKENVEFKRDNTSVLKQYSGTACTINEVVYNAVLNGSIITMSEPGSPGSFQREILSLSNTELKFKEGNAVYLLNKI